jgi:hypothetical protein
MFDRVQLPDQNQLLQKKRQEQEQEAAKKKKKAGINPDFFNYMPNLGSPDFNPIQKKGADTNSTETTSNKSQSSKSGLPNDVNSKMPASQSIGAGWENAFATSFKDVNIHTNDKSASELGALAYTQGNDVHFAPGQFNPNSKKGQELIGHELTHVVQQKEGRVKSPNIGDMKPTIPKKSDRQLKKEELNKDYYKSISGGSAAKMQFQLKYGKDDLVKQYSQKHFDKFVSSQTKQLKRNKQENCR